MANAPGFGTPPPPHDPSMPFRGSSKPPAKKAPAKRSQGSATGPFPPMPPPGATTWPSSTPTTLTPEQQLVQQWVTAAQLPQMQAIQNEQAASSLAAKNSATSTAGYYQALAKILGSIGPQTQAGYQQAAGADSAFGKGFANGLAMVQDQAGQQTNDALGVAGAPPAQTAQANAALGGTGATDALYALGGYIPATTMSREGAAFGAAADLLPATAGGQGAQAIQGIAAQQRLDQQGFAKQYADLAAQAPGLALEYGQKLAAQKAANQAEADRVANAKAHEADVKTQQKISYILATGVDDKGNLTPKARAELSAALGYDPVTGKPTAKTTLGQENASTARARANTAINQYNLAVDRFNAAQKNTEIKALKPDSGLSGHAGYFVDSYGNPVLDSKGHIHLLPGFTIKGGEVVKVGTKHTLTAKQIQDYDGQSRRIAEGAFNGLPAVPNANGIGNKYEKQDPISWDKALKEELAAGVPINIAIAALNVYYQQGQRGRPWNGPPPPAPTRDRNPKRG